MRLRLKECRVRLRLKDSAPRRLRQGRVSACATLDSALAQDPKAWRARPPWSKVLVLWMVGSDWQRRGRHLLKGPQVMSLGALRLVLDPVALPTEVLALPAGPRPSG